MQFRRGTRTWSQGTPKEQSPPFARTSRKLADLQVFRPLTRPRISHSSPASACEPHVCARAPVCERFASAMGDASKRRRACLARGTRVEYFNGEHRRRTPQRLLSDSVLLLKCLLKSFFRRIFSKNRKVRGVGTQTFRKAPRTNG